MHDISLIKSTDFSWVSPAVQIRAPSFILPGRSRLSLGQTQTSHYTLYMICYKNLKISQG